MITIDDSSHHGLVSTLAIGSHDENFALDDYVIIEQEGVASWAGQIISPNANIILNGPAATVQSKRFRALLQQYGQAHEMESIQIYEIHIIAEFKNKRLVTSRRRPLPGSQVTKLPDDIIRKLTDLADTNIREDGTSNVIGVLLNAEQLPMGIDSKTLSQNVLIAGVSGSGKANLTANLVVQSVEQGFCAIVHDTQRLFYTPNEAADSPLKLKLFEPFSQYGCKPRGCKNTLRVGIHGFCNPLLVEKVIGFKASDFPAWEFSSLFISETEDPELHSVLAQSSAKLHTSVGLGDISDFSAQDIIEDLHNRANKSKVTSSEIIDEAISHTLIKAVQQKQKQLPWLDAIGLPAGEKPHLNPKLAARAKRNQQFGGTTAQTTDNQLARTVESLNLANEITPGKLIIIDHSEINHDNTYAIIASLLINQVHDAISVTEEDLPTLEVLTDAHHLFDSENSTSKHLFSQLNKVVHDGSNNDHSLLLSIEDAGQAPKNWLKQFSTKFIMRQGALESAKQVMHGFPELFTEQALQLGTGNALVQLGGFRFPILIETAPGPFKLGS